MPRRKTLARNKPKLSTTAVHWCITGNDFWREYKTDDAMKTLRALWDQYSGRIRKLVAPIVPRAAVALDGEPDPGSRPDWSMDQSRKLLAKLEEQSR